MCSSSSSLIRCLHLCPFLILLLKVLLLPCTIFTASLVLSNNWVKCYRLMLLRIYRSNSYFYSPARHKPSVFPCCVVRGMVREQNKSQECCHHQHVHKGCSVRHWCHIFFRFVSTNSPLYSPWCYSQLLNLTLQTRLPSERVGIKNYPAPLKPNLCSHHRSHCLNPNSLCVCYKDDSESLIQNTNQNQSHKQARKEED